MSEFIAEAQVLIRPDTSKFRAELEAQLLVATKGIVVPVSIAAAGESAQVSGALSAVATENRNVSTSAREAAVNTARESASLEVLGATSVKTAAAQRELAASMATSARRTAQAERGAASSALTFLGLRGATLAASGAFLAGAAGLLLFTKSIKEASDQTEQLNKSREVFGQFSKEVEDFAKTSAESFGESNAKALELVSTFGALLRPIGFTQEAAAKQSLALTKLGADLASFFNTDVAGALNALESGITGQVRPLRRFGVELSAARVNALALADSGKKVVSSLTDQEKVAARIKIIFRDSTIAQGDFSRTSQEFANQTRILTAEVSDLEGELGRLAIPALTTVLQIFTAEIKAANTLAGAVGDVAGAFSDLARSASRIPSGKLIPEVPKQEGGFGGFLRGLSGDIAGFEKTLSTLPGLFIQSTTPVQTESEKTAAAVRKIFDAASETDNIAKFDGQMNHLIETLRAGTPDQQKSADQLQKIKGAIDTLGNLPTPKVLEDIIDKFTRMGPAAQTAVPPVNALAQALSGLQAQAFAANSALLKLQNEGASPQAQIGNLQGQRKIQEDIIANLKSNGNQSGDATKINAARTQINTLNAQIKSLQSGIVSDQKAAAASAQAAADEAQKARDDQFQGLADLFGGRQQKIEDQIARAGIVGNIAKEQRLNKALIASLKKERAALIERLKTLNVSRAVRKAILDAINRAIEAAQQDTIRFQQEQQKNLSEFATPKIDLRIQIAQARDDVKAEIALRRQRLALINAEILKLARAGKKNTLAWLQLKVQQAEEKRAIRDLEKETKDKQGAQKSLFFTFLQTQQGFAANLLGNLIPGFATGGLVGGSAQPASAGDGLRQVAGGFEQPRGAVQGQAALASSRDRGVRPVQVDTTNALLRQILRSLQNLNGRASHPEARYQNRVAGSNMDTIGGV